MRLYLPATLPLLTGWLSAKAADVADLVPAGLGYAVTPTLREWYREADVEELEHAAQVAASVASLGLLALDPAAPRRRVVVAVDLPDADVVPAVQQGRAAVAIAAGTTIPVARWGSALVDDPDAIAVVSAAADAYAAARGGDDDAQFLLDEAEAYELGWHGVQELPYL